MTAKSRRLSVALLLALPALRGVESEAPAEPAETEATKYVRALAERSKSLRSIHVRFRQEKRLRLLRRPRTSEGELWYSGGRLSMVVRRAGAVESHLLMKDGELRILYPELKRLETMELGSGGEPSGRDARASIPLLAGDWQTAERDYEISLEREGERVTLVLVPRDAESPVKRLRMVLVRDRLREYSQEERSGNEVRMEILGWDENGPIAEKRFELDVPSGTKTVPLR